MPAVWQKWMPLHIDKFYGSPWVQAMHPTAAHGYLRLITCQWQSEDCTVSADEEELAVLSGLAQWGAWDEHKRAILRHFQSIGDGRLQNSMCLQLWEDARTTYEANAARREAVREKRSQAARVANEKRWGKSESDAEQVDHTCVANGSQTDRKRIAKHPFTDTETGTEKHKKPSGKPVADLRHVEFRDAIDRYWRHVNPHAGERAPWDGSDAKALTQLLTAKPDLLLGEFLRLLNNRARSPDEVQSERPRVWLPNILRFAGGPLDRYGKPLRENGHGTGTNGASRTKSQRTLDALAEVCGLDEARTVGRGGDDGFGDRAPRRVGPSGVADLRANVGDVSATPDPGDRRAVVLDATR